MTRVLAVSLTLALLSIAARGVWAGSVETKARVRVHAARRRGGWISAPQSAERYDLRVAGRVERIYF